MNIYDYLIEDIGTKTGAGQAVSCAYDPGDNWTSSDHYQLILQKEMAYELGGGTRPGINFTCVTTREDLFDGDEILVYGKDLPDLKEDAPYARITLLLTKELPGGGEDTEASYRAIQSMDFVKYHVFPEGYMLRTSSHNNREQVRISQKALKKGLSFRHVGNTYIRNYKKNKLVKNVKVLFITAPDADYEGLRKTAEKVTEITTSLSKILEGMPTDCAACGLKEICDEVEGLRELHFGRKEESKL